MVATVEVVEATAFCRSQTSLESIVKIVVKAAVEPPVVEAVEPTVQRPAKQQTAKEIPGLSRGRTKHYQSKDRSSHEKFSCHS